MFTYKGIIIAGGDKIRKRSNRRSFGRQRVRFRYDRGSLADFIKRGDGAGFVRCSPPVALVCSGCVSKSSRFGQINNTLRSRMAVLA
jgi:hypothetical protein